MSEKEKRNQSEERKAKIIIHLKLLHSAIRAELADFIVIKLIQTVPVLPTLMTEISSLTRKSMLV